MSIKDWTSKVKGVEKSDVVWGWGGGLGGVLKITKFSWTSYV